MIRSLTRTPAFSRIQRATYAARVAKKKEKNDDDIPTEEIKVHIPCLSKDEIYVSLPNAHVDQLSVDTFNSDNAGKVFQIQSKFVETIDEHFGMPLSLKRSKPAGLLRASTVDSANVIESEVGKKSVIFIDGHKGTGKTLNLWQLISNCKDKNWVVFHLPTVLGNIVGTYPFAYNKDTQLYDQPDAAAKILSYFEKQNSHVLDKMSLSGAVKVGTQTLSNLNTVKDLVALGKAPENAMGAYDALIKELCNMKQFRVLFSIDMINAFYMPTLYRNSESEVLYPKDFTITKSLMDLVEKASHVENGVVVASTSSYVMGPEDVEDGLEAVREKMEYVGAIKMPVKSFSFAETDEWMRHLVRTGLIPRGKYCTQLVQKAYLLTGGNGKELFEFGVNRPLL